MSKIWFRRKKWGWGWTPVSWEGWLVLVVYVFLMIREFMRVDATSHSNSDTLIGFALPFIVGSLILICICYWKGEEPRWQWGKKDDSLK